MKYSVKITETGYVETLEVNGKEYKKTWCDTDNGVNTSDDDFCEQLKADGVDDDDFLDDIYNVIDESYIAFDLRDLERSLHC